MYALSDPLADGIFFKTRRSLFCSVPDPLSEFVPEEPPDDGDW